MSKSNIAEQSGNKHVHFIGIGGCSMSGLAQILAANGLHITGSDLKESNFTRQLQDMGIEVHIGHDKKHVQGADQVVYSAAIKRHNPEFAYAAAHQIPMIERSKLLGEISSHYGTVASIAGCHGKTTITSMLALIMEESEADCTVHVGGMVDFLGSGVRLGKGDCFITEACEYVRSFLTLHPTDILVNNIDDDHLDCYRDLEDIFNTFVEFIKKQDQRGVLLLNVADDLTRRLQPHAKGNVVTFGLPEQSDWYIENPHFDALGSGGCAIVHKGNTVANLQLQIPGMYNLNNALAAIAFAYEVFGVVPQTAADALAHYNLVGRRFELVGKKNGVRIYHDYAHHPNEIMACLEGAKRIPHNKLWVVFQVCSYTRAITLFDRYATSFDDADVVIVPDIHPGRDTDSQGMHAQKIVDAINKHSDNAVYIPTFEKINDHLHQHWHEDDIVITLGPGDVDKQQMIFFEDR